MKALLFAVALVIFTTTGLASDRLMCDRGGDDYRGVIASCSILIKQNPSDGAAYVNRSFAFERLDRAEEALRDGNEAVRLLPHDPQAFVNRAAALMSLKRYAEAEADLKKALQLDPDDQQARVNLGYLYQTMKQVPKAIEAYRRGAAINPLSHHGRFATKALFDLEAIRR